MTPTLPKSTKCVGVAKELHPLTSNALCTSCIIMALFHRTRNKDVTGKNGNATYENKANDKLTSNRNWMDNILKD